MPSKHIPVRRWRAAADRSTIGQKYQQACNGKLIALWHRDAGYSLVAGELDKLGSHVGAGIELQTNHVLSRPDWGADGANFCGRAVLKTGWDSRVQNLAVPASFLPAGSRPHMFAVMRMSALTGDLRFPLGLKSAGGTQLQLSYEGSNVIFRTYGPGGALGTGVAFADTRVHFVESFFTPTGHLGCAVDLYELLSSTGGYATTEPVSKILYGGNDTSGYGLDGYTALFGVCRAPLTQAQREALYDLATRDQGFNRTPEEVLGTYLVEHWDARYGIAKTGTDINSWTGRKQGWVLSPGANKPQHAPDGTWFGAKPVVQLGASPVSYLSNLSLPGNLFASGDRPFTIALARLRDRVSSGGTTGALYRTPSGGAWQQYWFGSVTGALHSISNNAGNSTVLDHVGRIFENYCTATDRKLDVDGTACLSQTIGDASVGAVGSSLLLNDGMSSSYANTSIAALLFCTAELPLYVRTALRALLRRDFELDRETMLPYGTVEAWFVDDLSRLEIIGGEVQKWTGRIRGIELTAPTAGARPTYAADGANFGGAPVIHTAASGKYLRANSINPPLFLSGSRPHAMVLARPKSFVAGVKQVLDVRNNAGATNCLAIYANGTFLEAQLHSAAVAAATFADTSRPHAFEAGITPAGVGTITADTCVENTSGSALATDAAYDTMAIGSASGPYETFNRSDCAIAAVILVALQPTAAERLASLQRLARRLPFRLPARPPAVATMLEYWDSRFGVSTTGTTITAWQGQIRGLSLVPAGVPNRPTYVRDSGLGKFPIVQCTISGPRYLRITAPAPALLTVLGSPRPVLLSFVRLRTAAGGTEAMIVRLLNGAGSLNTLALAGLSGNVSVLVEMQSASAPGDTAKHMMLGGIDAAGLAFLQLDGAAKITAGAPMSITSDSGAFSLGGSHIGTLPSDSSHGFHALCSAMPSDAELVEIAAFYAAEF